MSSFLSVVVRERSEGSPGVVGPEEFDILLNVNEVTLINRGEDSDVCFVRLTCGASLCLALSFDDFLRELEKLGVVIADAPKIKSKKKPTKKKK